MKLFKKIDNEYKEATLQEIRAHYNELKMVFKRGQVLNSAQTARRMIAAMGDLVTESMIILYVDNQNKIVHKEANTNNMEDQTAVYPKHIVRTALLNYATGILVAHNHPAGHDTPSSADDSITKKIKYACETLDIRFLDHIVVTDTNYYSYRESGRMEHM